MCTKHQKTTTGAAKGKVLHPRTLPTVVDRVFGVPLINARYKHLMQGAFITRKGRRREEHALIYKGDIQNITPDTVVTIRINSACFTGDIFGDELCDCNYQMWAALDIIDNHDGPGILLYHFSHEGKAHGYFSKLKAFDGEMYPVDGDLRDFTHSVAVLKDLGITKVRVMTNNPEKQQMLRDHGIEIVEIVPVVCDDPRHAKFYDYKAREWGHALPTLDGTGNGVADGDSAAQ